MFAVCGVPATLKGKLSAEFHRQTTAEVPVDFADGQFLALAMLHVASPDTTTPPPAPPAAPARGGKGAAAPVVASNVTGLRTGRAAVTGRVTNEMGQPLAGVEHIARGRRADDTSGTRWDIHLRGLPAGTQALVLRHVGYSLTDVTVDLSNVAVRQRGREDGACTAHAGPGDRRRETRQGAARRRIHDPVEGRHWLSTSRRTRSRSANQRK